MPRGTHYFYQDAVLSLLKHFLQLHAIWDEVKKISRLLRSAEPSALTTTVKQIIVQNIKKSRGLLRLVEHLLNNHPRGFYKGRFCLMWKKDSPALSNSVYYCFHLFNASASLFLKATKIVLTWLWHLSEAIWCCRCFQQSRPPIRRA